MNKIITLENGIRVSFEKIPNLHSVALGCVFGTGSAFETEKISGISHFIEHMCFKGTKNRTAFELVAHTDDLGINMNAYTGKETTCYYLQCLTEHTEVGLDILADLVINHTFPENELEKEKEVVIEEIKMCEDTPDDLSMELACAAFWGNNPLGMNILGTEEKVREFTREDLVKYVNERYIASNLVISVAGNVEEEYILTLIKKYFNDFRTGTFVRNPSSEMASEPRMLVSYKSNEQANICLTYKGLNSGSEDSNALSIINSCFGGAMSSVLFQRLREQLGLAYNVYVYSSRYMNAGAVSIYIGTSPNKVKTALEEIKKIIEEYSTKGFSNEEFVRGVNQQKSGYLMGIEGSPIALMRINANRIFTDNEPFDIDKELENINSVTLDDVNRLFKQIFSGVPSVGYVGKKLDFDILELLKQ